MSDLDKLLLCRFADRKLRIHVASRLLSLLRPGHPMVLLRCLLHPQLNHLFIYFQLLMYRFTNVHEEPQDSLYPSPSTLSPFLAEST